MDDRTAHWIEDRGIPVEIAAEHGLTSLNGHPAFVAAHTSLPLAALDQRAAAH